MIALNPLASAKINLASLGSSGTPIGMKSRQILAFKRKVEPSITSVSFAARETAIGGELRSAGGSESASVPTNARCARMSLVGKIIRERVTFFIGDCSFLAVLSYGGGIKYAHGRRRVDCRTSRGLRVTRVRWFPVRRCSKFLSRIVYDESQRPRDVSSGHAQFHRKVWRYCHRGPCSRATAGIWSLQTLRSREHVPRLGPRVSVYARAIIG